MVFYDVRQQPLGWRKNTLVDNCTLYSTVRENSIILMGRKKDNIRRSPHSPLAVQCHLRRLQGGGSQESGLWEHAESAASLLSWLLPPLSL